IWNALDCSWAGRFLCKGAPDQLPPDSGVSATSWSSPFAFVFVWIIKVLDQRRIACIGSNEYSNTAELTALENSSLEASIHAPASGDPQADPYGREGQVPVGNDTYLLCHITYLVIVIEYYMSPFAIDPMNGHMGVLGCLNVGASEILTFYAIMAINQGNFEGQLKM
ncbi:19731_t:CDS:2, partial [Rhizophagus irregularis]